MAVIAQTTVSGASAPVVMTVTTMTASDTLTYVANTNQLLELDNGTAGALPVVIVGTAPSAAYPVPNTSTTVSLTAGLTISVAAGQVKIVNLDKISAYLTGTGVCTLTGGTGIKARLFN
jgi:hypothetical protein